MLIFEISCNAMYEVIKFRCEVSEFKVVAVWITIYEYKFTMLN